LSKIRSGAALSDHEAVVPLQAAAARFTADAIGVLSARGIKDARFLDRALRRATPGQSRQGNGRVELHADPLVGCAGRRVRGVRRVALRQSHVSRDGQLVRRGWALGPTGSPRRSGHYVST